ncbi:MAG: hypothetical protein ACLUD2_18400 [Clostridium sp.]
MNELIAGIDLCDEYTQVNCNDEDEKAWTIPNGASAVTRFPAPGR